MKISNFIIKVLPGLLAFIEISLRINSKELFQLTVI